jgi:non-specific serine/threonine protein kinase
VADRHLAVYSALAAEAEEPLHGPAMVDWLDRLDSELDNLGAALEWGLEAAPWTAAQMAAALLGYWAVRVMSQDNDARIVAAIEIARMRVWGRSDIDPADQALSARLMGEAARLWAMSGRGIEALPWTEDAIVLADASGDPTARLYALGGLAVTTVFTGRAGPGGTDVRPIFEEAADLAEQTGQWWMLALAAGFAGASLGPFDPDGGASMLRRGVEAARRSGSPYAIGAVSMAQGRTLGRLGQTDDSVAAFGVAIQRFMELGDDRFVLASRSDLAHSLRRGGRLDEAIALYRETIGGWIHLGHKGAIANQLENIAYVEIERGEPERAVRLLGAADALREVARAKMAFDEEPEHAASLERLRSMMTDAGFEAAWTVGRALSQSDAVELALAGEAQQGSR